MSSHNYTNHMKETKYENKEDENFISICYGSGIMNPFYTTYRQVSNIRRT